MTDLLDTLHNENSCPRCGSPFIEAVKYTWWGGVLGPKLLHHTRCSECKYTFNSKTRKSNRNAIIIYSVVVGAAGLIVAFLLARRMGWFA